MPRTWFEHLVVSSPARQGRSSLGVALSIGTHAALAASLVVIPALGRAQLPVTPSYDRIDVFAAPVAPPTPPPEVRPQPRKEPTPTARVRDDPGPAAAAGATSPLPTRAIADFDQGIDSLPVCLAGCGPGSDPIGTGQATPGIGLPGAGTSPDPIRVGGPEVREPRRIHYVEPPYPELARRTRVTGIVILECVLDEGGLVRDVKVLRGHDLLSPAAVSAVRQWRYTPTLLNGVPVRVVMTVTVRFHFEGR